MAQKILLTEIVMSPALGRYYVKAYEIDPDNPSTVTKVVWSPKNDDDYYDLEEDAKAKKDFEKNKWDNEQ